MNKNKQLFINLTAQLVSFIVNLGINFFLTPYIVNNVGESAYGFVSLGNNLISYAQIISIALNSMASRFITIKIVEGDIKQANKYFTSVLFANIFISIALFIPFVFFVLFLPQILVVPTDILMDVRILFILLLLNFIISIVFSVYSVATFAKNKLYLTSIRTIIAYVFRILVLLVSFCFFKPSIWYVGLAAFVFTGYVSYSNYKYTRKLLPEIETKIKNFDKNKVKELLSCGIWNAITRLGQILLDGLDLIIANLFIGPIQMGILSISKTIPMILSSVISTVVSVFMPDFTIEYAKGNDENLLHSLKQSMKILSIFTAIPISILIIYGQDFFQLWVPDQDAQLLQMLSLLSIAVLMISGGVNCIYNIFTVVNKIKPNAIMLISTGILSTILVYVLLKTTNLGLFAIAGVSSLLGVVRNLCFTVPYGAKCINQKWYIFYVDVLRTLLCIMVVSLVGLIVKSFLSANTWIWLIISCAIVCLIGLALELVLVLNKQERQFLIKKIVRRS